MIKKLLLTPLLAIATSLLIATSAVAQASKFNLTANLGYAYNLASKWDSAIGNNKGNSGFGYGARLGYNHSSGFGLFADYLALTSKWSSGGLDYINPYHVVTITPSYRVSFGEKKEWGVKLGLGIGVSVADMSWGATKTANGVNSKVAGGAIYMATLTTNALAQEFCGINGVVGDDIQVYDSVGGLSGGTTVIDRLNCFHDGVSTPYTHSLLSDMLVGNTLAAIDFHGGSFTEQGTRSALVTYYYNQKIEELKAQSPQSGKAKDDASFVLVPEIALEHDNGLFHADISARYIHQLFDVKYEGVHTTIDQLQKSGPRAVFIGAGLGVNF